MPASVLRTKLFAPPVRPGVVVRPRLIERLNSGRGCKLTLVSAPAGFGKTTLLSTWLASIQTPFAWLSLDDSDNDPTRFLIYFIYALRQFSPDIGSGILAMLQSSQIGAAHLPGETLLTELVNEIAGIPGSLIVVLDDFHVITEPTIQAIFTFLLEHQPAGLHLVVSGRADPPWPLARLRASGSVAELRSKDLRFSPEEAASFLNDIMGLHLSTHQVQALEACTEGWIAGLQMAAISMQGRSDVNGFIEAFTGSHRFIADFLLEEVLLGQPPSIQAFLLKTSILERFCAPLADAILAAREELDPPVSDPPSSQKTLDYLEHTNLFLIPLDDERHWYRYHHLFRDLLRSNLMSSEPDQVHQLHLKASHWLATAGLYEDAISHAFASSNSAWTADLIEKAARQVDIQNKLVVVAGWIDALPETEVAARPWLCVYRAWGQHWTGHRSQVESSLATAEKALSTSQDLSPEMKNHINGHIAAIRSHSALVAEDIPLVLEAGEKALALLPNGDEMRCETGVALGGAYWALGDVHRSEKAFASARADALLGGFATMAVPSSCYVGMMQTKQARLIDAIQTYQDALTLATSPDGKELPVAGFPNTKLGDLFRERDELDQAETLLVRGVIQCQQLGQADVLTDGYVCLARLQIARGNLDGAQASLEEALQVANRTNIDPFVRCWLDECRIRLWLKRGDLGEAMLWEKASGLTYNGELSFHYDLHHINLARVMVASGIPASNQERLNQALSLLERIMKAAVQFDWTQELIKCQVLIALALQGLNAFDKALQALTQALHLAMPAGYFRTFLDEGAPMDPLLAGVRQQADIDPQMAVYIDKLLLGLNGTAKTSGRKPAAPPTSHPVGRNTIIIEPLTEREIDVLRLLKSGLTSTEIAVELYLSVHTVRTHMKNIYRKLAVNRRIEAVQRATEAGLLK